MLGRHQGLERRAIRPIRKQVFAAAQEITQEKALHALGGLISLPSAFDSVGVFCAGLIPQVQGPHAGFAFAVLGW